MPTPVHRPRVAVLSPFIDKRHGTERCVAEQIERLASVYEIHLYSSSVEDIDLSKITWHHVPEIAGPHLIRYVWWLLANQYCRWRDSRFKGLAPDVVYSAGANCLSADIVSVHILFSKTRVDLRDTISLSRNPVGAWPLMIHRRIYYRLVEFLEDRLYSRDNISLIAVSKRGAQDIRDRFRPSDGLRVGYSYYGVDPFKFSPMRRQDLRKGARRTLGYSDAEFVILLIGNDWRKKGLQCLLEAVAQLKNSRLRILVVGQDSSAFYTKQMSAFGLVNQVQFLPSRLDVEFYYAAADVYVGPSLEDTFSLPPAEAMSCGMAVITTRAAGVSEIIHHGKDGLILEDPVDAPTLSEWIGRLANDEKWCRQLGAAATISAGKYTWERNAQQLGEVIDSIVQSRKGK